MPTPIKGSWEGKYANGKKFEVDISQVVGFRAQVKYQSEGTVEVSAGADQGQFVSRRRFQVPAARPTTRRPIKTVVTDPATGSTYLDTAYATRDV